MEIINEINKCALPAHSAYTFDETATCIKAAFTDIQHVEVLYKFTNFTKAVEPLLNVAAQTAGQYHALPYIS